MQSIIQLHRYKPRKINTQPRANGLWRNSINAVIVHGKRSEAKAFMECGMKWREREANLWKNENQSARAKSALYFVESFPRIGIKFDDFYWNVSFISIFSWFFNFISFHFMALIPYSHNAYYWKTELHLNRLHHLRYTGQSY